MAYIESKKNELYTADELCTIKTALSEATEKSASLIEKITKMQNSIKDKQKQALFFMPAQTYNLFSVFKNQNAICDISKNDIKAVISILEKSSLPQRLMEKLNVLNDFLQQDNTVYPVVTAIG